MKKILFLAALFMNVAFAVPAWFLESPQNNDGFVYGSGSALSKEEATNMALNDALSKIRTTVGGVIKNESVLTNNKISEETSVRITNEVEKFSLSGYIVSKLEYEKKEKLFFAQVKIDKIKIYNEKFLEFETDIEAVSGLLQSLNTAETLFKKLQFAKKISKKAEAMGKNLYILFALNSNFPFKERLQKNNEYLGIKDKILNTAGFKVEGSGQISNTLKEVIAEEKLKTTGKIIIKITFSMPAKQSKGLVYGSFFYKNLVNIEMMEGGKIVNVLNLNIGGTSAVSEEEAYIQALKDLKRQFKSALENVIN